MPYAFTPEDYSKFQSELLEAGGDQATVTSILTDFQDTFTESYSEVLTSRAEMERIKAENNRLKQTNMELFQRHVGTPVQQIKEPEPEPPESKYKNVDEYLTDYFSRK